MDMDMDEQPAAPPPPPPRPQDGAPPPPPPRHEEEEEEEINIVRNYAPTVGGTAPAEQTMIDPITKRAVPIAEVIQAKCCTANTRAYARRRRLTHERARARASFRTCT